MSSLSTNAPHRGGQSLGRAGRHSDLSRLAQAKGRIERFWGTFQDRLVSELRLAKAKTLTQAQAVLKSYLGEHNRKFSNPTQAQPAGRKASAQQIEQALCFKEKRSVANDNTITFDGVLFQITKKSPHHSYVNKRIDVPVLLDGSVELFYKQENRRL
jgi:hypothetical protein